jgi:hypothetical protein
MTRRDYCAVCSEKVSDSDPMCNECDRSFCHGCPKKYDSISRLSLLYCEIRVYNTSFVSKTKEKQFIEDINSKQFIDVFGDDEDHIEIIKNITDEYKKHNNSISGTRIREFLYHYFCNENYYKCYMCFKKVKIEY